MNGQPDNPAALPDKQKALPSGPRSGRRGSLIERSGAALTSFTRASQHVGVLLWLPLLESTGLFSGFFRVKAG